MTEIKINGKVLVVPSREVYIPELKDNVLVTTDQIREKYIKNGDENDDLFACYVDESIFNSMPDDTFQKFILDTFYD